MGDHQKLHTFRSGQIVTSIANKVGVDEKTIRNIFAEYVEHLKSTVKFETLIWMGIDDIHIMNAIE